MENLTKEMHILFIERFKFNIDRNIFFLISANVRASIELATMGDTRGAIDWNARRSINRGIKSNIALNRKKKKQK